jgi:Na+/melibiose symporter-like transporter
MIWFIIAAVPATVLLVLLSTPEKVARDHAPTFRLSDYAVLLRRGDVIRLMLADLCISLGPGCLSALYLFFLRESRGFDAAQANLLLLILMLAGLVGAPFNAWLANRISKHRTFIVATVAFSLSLISMPFLQKGSFLLFAPVMFLMGCIMSGFAVMVRAITADIADEIRLDTGHEWMGQMYALTTATYKLASAGAIFLAFNLLDWIGFQAKAGAVNTPQAIHGLELAFTVVPIFFVLIAGGCFRGYRLNADRHADIRRQLDERDAATDSAAAPEPFAGEDLVSAARPASLGLGELRLTGDELRLD